MLSIREDGGMGERNEQRKRGIYELKKSNGSVSILLFFGLVRLETVIENDSFYEDSTNLLITLFYNGPASFRDEYVDLAYRPAE